VAKKKQPDPAADAIAELFADAPAVEASDGELKEISRLVDLWLEKAREKAAMEAALKDLGEEMRLIEERDLPDALTEAGLEEVKTASGAKVTVEQVVRANIPKAQEGPAFDWLRSNNHGDLIKRQLVANFGRGQDNLAGTAKAALEEILGEPPDDKQTVPWNTLTAFVKEQMAAGANLPADLLGIYTGRKAKIKEK